MDRSYRVGPDGRIVLCDAIVDRRDVVALLDALAWRRDELSRVEIEDAEAVLALRALMVIDDMLDTTSHYQDHAPLTLGRDQVHALCEIAGSYVSARDLDGYQAPEERDRIERLRNLAGSLMDCCCELAAATEEVRERAISV